MQTTLKNLSSLISSKGIQSELLGDGEISGVSSDSRAVKHGDLFAALPGLTVSGNKFDWAAKEKGAAAILTATKSDAFESQIIVDDVHRALGVVSSEIFQNRVAQQFSVGVTGTNGKTSIAFLIAQAISHLNNKAVYGGTLGLKALEEGIETGGVETDTTTPDMVEFHKFLGLQTESKGFAVEISSMALDQKRLCGLELDVVIFSNLTRDHLDYHNTLECYFDAKKKLFLRDLKESSKKNKTAILNIKHENLRQFAEELKEKHFNVWGYSVDAASTASFNLTKLIKYSLSLDGAKFEFELDRTLYSGATKLIGQYNLENILAVISALRSLGYSAQQIVEVLPKLSGVPGRVQRVTIGQENTPTVLVDYAHTPDALDNALRSVRELVKGRLITVFGCGGDRDQGKRPMMADVASRLSDLTIITSDNPRTENPRTIIEQAEKGLVPGRESLSIVDRKAAIFQAISQASPTDTVLIAGKGHEPYQEINGVKHRFLDEEVASDALREFFIPIPK